MDKLKSRTLKVHIIFSVALALALLVAMIPKLAAGEWLLQALGNSVREIRPVEWLMIFVFWYSAASPRPKDEWPPSSITTLGLSPRQ
ncbi:MAG TPA: hypothetical protein VK475_09690 [Pyrinomonadaceae bacterium]|nr:hypothetical protein [Pyrinomonadaceae bacterium]